MAKHGDEVEGDGLDGDRRRARFADLARVEALLNQAMGRIAALEALLERQRSEPVSKPEFYARFYANIALSDPKNAKHARTFCDQAWTGYQEALACKPRTTLEQMYGGAPAEPLAPADATGVPV